MKVRSLDFFIILGYLIVMGTLAMPCAAQSSAFPKQVNARGDQVVQLVAEGVTALERD